MAWGPTLDLVGCSLAAATALCSLRSCRWLRRTAGAAPAADAPGVASNATVSLLVPARNEEDNIAECVVRLADAGGLEVLVLDDASTDATAERARAALVRSGAPGRVLAGRPLEPGWGGKSFACQQLAEAARGEWLFFVDADVRIASGGAARALRQAQAVDAELASFLPRYVGAHWANRFVVPWLYYLLTALIPVPEIPRVRHPRLAVAVGQAVLVRRDAYERLGGHAAVRSHVIEDVSLAIAAKRAGVRVALLDGHAWLDCRMYASGRGLIEGFAKSFHSAAALHPFQWAALTTLLVLVGVRPWWRIAAAAEPLLALSTLAIVTATFAGLLVRFRQRVAAAAPWPLSLAALVAVSVVAGVRGLLGRPVRWRGRVIGGAPRFPAEQR